jgi:hypothetical protein
LLEFYQKLKIEKFHLGILKKNYQKTGKCEFKEFEEF